MATSAITDISDLTDQIDLPVTNDQFIEAIFAPRLGIHRPLVCGFAPDPRTAKSWAATPWPCQTANELLNWFVAPALFKPDESGKYHAKESLACSVHALMLDDLGSKIPMDRISADTFSWLLETSPGNFQGGFIFDAPIFDIQSFTQLKRDLIQAGLCDPAASGAAARWMRLPSASNTKQIYGTPSPKCRLAVWQPQRRYSIDELRYALNLIGIPVEVDDPVSKLDLVATLDTPKHSDLGEQVITALKGLGLYKQQLSTGKHDITCPWVTEHTDSVDHGTAYFEPSPKYPKGGFKCFHSHGEKYHIRELLDKLNIETQFSTAKPNINITPGSMHSIVEEAEAIIDATGNYFQRSGQIVSVEFDPMANDHFIRAVSGPALTKETARLIEWTAFRKGEIFVVDPPARHLRILHESASYKTLRPLRQLTRQPYLRDDGTLAINSGYDARTGMYGIFKSEDFDIPEEPSRSDCMMALEVLRDLLSEFAFERECDRAAALALLLTASIRPSLTTAPMFHVRAPQIASGKSYLCSLAAAFASPSHPAVLSFPSNEEEAQKHILATLLEAPASVIFDNLTSDIKPLKTLCSTITEGYIQGRILGQSKVASVSTRALFMSSGNNVSPTRDMTRRVLQIVLDPMVEIPATRTFQMDPLRTVREGRAEYVSLALTIIRGAIVNRISDVTGCKKLGSFDLWSDWVRKSLIWLGLPDPATRLFEQMAEDPERDLIARVISTWTEEFGSSPTKVRDVIQRSNASPELRQALLEVAGKGTDIDARRLGRWLSRTAGRVVGQQRLIRLTGGGNVEVWAVQDVDPAHAFGSVTSERSVNFPAAAVQSMSNWH